MTARYNAGPSWRGGLANKFSQPYWHGRGLWQLEAPAGASPN
jgi:hypothetical protein